MVSEDKIVVDLDYALFIFCVVFLDQEKQFGLNCRLVVVFLLILDKLHRYQLLGLVIEAFKHLTKGTFSDLLNDLKPEANLVVLRNSIVAVAIVIAVVNDTFGLAWVNLKVVLSEIEDFFELCHLLHLGLSQEL